MPFAPRLSTWIAQTRAALDPANPPTLLDVSVGAPWDAIREIRDECADDAASFQQLTDACEAAILAAGEDVCARFVVLHFLYWFRVGLTPYEPDDEREAYDRVDAALSRIVELLPVGDCPKAWPGLRWEITNAYAAGLWNRAIALYDFAERERVLATRSARLMRGHCRYLVAAGRGSTDDPLYEGHWEPRVLGSEDDFHPPAPTSGVEVADMMAQVRLLVDALGSDLSSV
jgi:hypothetical protein